MTGRHTTQESLKKDNYLQNLPLWSEINHIHLDPDNDWDNFHLYDRLRHFKAFIKEAA